MTVGWNHVGSFGRVAMRITGSVGHITNDLSLLGPTTIGAGVKVEATSASAVKGTDLTLTVKIAADPAKPETTMANNIVKIVVHVPNASAPATPHSVPCAAA